MAPTITHLTYTPTAQRHRFLWLMGVEAVELDEQHCLRCLVGERHLKT